LGYGKYLVYSTFAFLKEKYFRIKKKHELVDKEKDPPAGPNL
jgi:hypothetical protein